MHATLPDLLDCRLPATPENVRRARGVVRSTLEEHHLAIDPETVALCVSEAVTNVILHAYRGSGSGEFALTGQVDHDALVISVCDEGGGIRPREDSPGAGLGLHLISELADDVEVGGAERGGRVTMRFALRSRSSAPAS
jgi:anti-sigma regulatory factor (Ser/Thr protein kinase)